MVKKILFVFLLLSVFRGNSVIGQSVIDSLRIEMSELGEGDIHNEKKAEICLRLSEEYESVNTDSFNYFIDKGFSFYSKPDYGSRIYLGLINGKANYHFVNGDFKLAKSMFNEALTHAPSLKERDYTFESTVAMSLGVAYRKLGMTDSTLYYYNHATDLSKISGDKSTLSAIYYNIGAMYFGSERYEDALPNGEISAKYAEEADDINMYMYARILVASAYSRMKKYSESAEILKDNIEKALSRDHTLLAMSSFGPLLSTYQLWEKKDSARIYLEKYEKYIEKIPQGSPTALELISTRASLYNWMGEHRKCRDILLNNPQVLAQISYEAYHRLLAHSYKGLGDYKNAFINIQEAYAYCDSIMKTQVNREMSELNAKLNINAKELEISRLENEKALQKASQVRLGIYMGVIIIILFIIILMLQHKRKIQRKEAELNSAKRYIEGLENERKRLAKDLHDGVCSDLLGVIMQMKRSDVSDKDSAVEMLENIRSGVRTISHELMPPSFQLTDLDEMLYDYFAKMEEQTGMRIEYVSHSDSGWNLISHKVGYEVYRIVQEILSNMIKYSGAGKIDVRMEHDGETLRLVVSHDGNWDEDGNKKRGIGMRTIDDRLKTIGGTYSITRENGVSISINVNLSGNTGKR